MEQEIKQQREKLSALYDNKQQKLNTILVGKQNGSLTEKQSYDILNSPDYLDLQKQIAAENKVLQDLIKEQDKKNKNAVAAKMRYWAEKSSEALGEVAAAIQEKKAVYEKAANLHSDLMAKIGALRKRRIQIADRLESIPIEHAGMLLKGEEPNMAEFEALEAEAKTIGIQVTSLEQAATVAATRKREAYHEEESVLAEHRQLVDQIHQREQSARVQKAVQAFTKAGGEGEAGGLFDAILSLMDSNQLPKTHKFNQRISWERAYWVGQKEVAA